LFVEKLSSIIAGLGAGLGAALLFGVAGSVGFDALFSAIPLGNEKDRAIIGMLVGLLSGCAGVFVGFWWVARNSGPAFAGLRITFLGMAGLFGLFVAALTIQFGLTNEKPFNHSIAHVEIRLPAGAAVPPNGPIGESYQVDRIDVSVRHGNQWRSLEFGEKWLRRDGERPVLMASGWLERDEKPLAIMLVMPGQPFKYFDLDLAPSPEPMGFAEWRRVTSIRDRGEPQSRPSDASDETEMRVRITRRR
jgi:hypothetical protein